MFKGSESIFVQKNQAFDAIENLYCRQVKILFETADCL